MRTPTYEEILADPDAVLMSIERAARAARAEAVQQIIVAPVKQLFDRMGEKPGQVLQPHSA
jgi:hypothetical protein